MYRPGCTAPAVLYCLQMCEDLEDEEGLAALFNIFKQSEQRGNSWHGGAASSSSSSSSSLGAAPVCSQGAGWACCRT